MSTTERIRKWHALLADSLFTQSGTQQFLDRLGLPACASTTRRPAPTKADAQGA